MRVCMLLDNHGNRSGFGIVHPEVVVNRKAIDGNGQMFCVNDSKVFRSRVVPDWGNEDK